MKNEMDNKNWLDEYTALKQVNPNNPFTVPSGYFSDLTERIVSLKNIAALNIERDGFTVPENYFNELSSNIQSRITIQSALNVENTGFKVPENYFNDLSNNIQSRISIEEAIGNENAGFEIPQGYFENMQQQITARIAVEEALSVRTEETFAVPAGYFDKLSAAILYKTVNAQPEVITEPVQRRGIVRRMFASGIYKYAAAACVTIAVGATFLLNSNTPAPAENTASYLHNRLSNIPVSEIKNYVEQNLDAGETQTTLVNQNISNEEILDYIDTEL
ncbi:MAG: hypothetical protein EOP46_21275 [Sphingobacteriaceae bacterium]|nr:MAG: hypothetical protein EOP46_21275 [Sphingobacteriaceae bacterium]